MILGFSFGLGFVGGLWLTFWFGFLWLVCGCGGRVRLCSVVATWLGLICCLWFCVLITWNLVCVALCGLFSGRLWFGFGF